MTNEKRKKTTGRPVLQYFYRLPKSGRELHIFARSATEALRAVQTVCSYISRYDFDRFASKNIEVPFDPASPDALFGETVAKEEALAAFPPKIPGKDAR